MSKSDISGSCYTWTNSKNELKDYHSVYQVPCKALNHILRYKTYITDNFHFIIQGDN